MLYVLAAFSVFRGECPKPVADIVTEKRNTAYTGGFLHFFLVTLRASHPIAHPRKGLNV
jgi:hypothetical protein